MLPINYTCHIKAKEDARLASTQLLFFAQVSQCFCTVDVVVVVLPVFIALEIYHHFIFYVSL